MRTKALLLTAALGLAGAATSMAQAVYSVNVVGYINLTMKPGFNMVANQLKASPNNTLGTLFPTAPVGAQVQKFVLGNYVTDLFNGATWEDGATGDPSTLTLSPGEGFFFFNPLVGTDHPVTFVGEVETGNDLRVPLPPGFSLVSSKVPQQIALSGANGFTSAIGMQYQTFNSGTQNYNDTLLYNGSAWENGSTGDVVPDPTTDVGAGFFIFNPDGVNHDWVRSFNPNNP